MNPTSQTRVSVYVDGFNLFYGLRDSKLRKYYWLNLETLSHSFLEERSVLSDVKYFTAPVKGDEAKHKRQSLYLDALSTCSKVKIYRGCYLKEPFFCGRCQNRRDVWKEKQTDTNIATELVADAFLNRWDIAFLISGDSDLVPPVNAIKEHFPLKKVIVIFPPSRISSALSSIFGTPLHINETKLRNNQFPEKIQIGEKAISKPDDWN